MDKVTKYINKFYQRQKRIKELNQAYEKEKQLFYKRMTSLNKDEIVVNELSLNGKEIVVKKIQTTKIEFDPIKVEKILGPLSEEAIDKEVTIKDLKGFIKLMKDHGIKPDQFKKYINVSKRVNKSKLDNLEEIGEISLDDLKGAYSVKTNSPYFKLSVRDPGSEGGGE